MSGPKAASSTTDGTTSRSGPLANLATLLEMPAGLKPRPWSVTISPGRAVNDWSGVRSPLVAAPYTSLCTVGRVTTDPFGVAIAFAAKVSSPTPFPLASGKTANITAC